MKNGSNNTHNNYTIKIQEKNVDNFVNTAFKPITFYCVKLNKQVIPLAMLKKQIMVS